jgi:hypothetical protein
VHDRGRTLERRPDGTCDLRPPPAAEAA